MKTSSPKRKSKTRVGSRKTSKKRVSSIKSKNRVVGSRKKSKKRFGSSPRAGSPKFRTVSPKITNLPNEILDLIYDKMPSGRDRAALAATSKQMHAVASNMNVYRTVEHVIRKESDIDAAIAHRATHVTFKDRYYVHQLHRMPFITHLNVEAPRMSHGLYTLPPLPSKLKVLNCSGNELEYLPVLPSTLVELNCRSNQLVELPPTLPPNLVILNCRNNKLTRLPTLPQSLKILNCEFNWQLERHSCQPCHRLLKN